MTGLPLVQLVSTGWGFHALDKDGRVWTWGRLAYTSLRLYDNQPEMLTTPTDIACLAGGRAVMLAMGRRGEIWQWHCENKPIRVLLAPQHAQTDQAAEESSSCHYRHRHCHLGNTMNDSTDPVVKLTAGWDLCAVLTSSGRLFAWNHQTHAQLTQQTGDHGRLKWIYLQMSTELRDQGELGARLASQGDKFVNVAAGLDFLVALTGQGYVFKFMALKHHGSPSAASQQLQQQQHSHPQYDQGVEHAFIPSVGPLDHLEASLEAELDHPPLSQQHQQGGSEMDDASAISPTANLTVVCPQAVSKHGVHLAIFTKALQQNMERHRQSEEANALSTTPSLLRPSNATDHDMEDRRENEGTNQELDPRLQRLRERQSRKHRLAKRQHPLDPTPFQVSAGYQRFALFHQDTPVVLLGHRQAQSSTPPTVLSRLLDSKPCALAIGDYHQALLTDDGQLRTWGGFAEGALGHGDLRLDISTPTVVHGGGLRHKFVFRVALAGWQSGCLAIELPEEDDVGQRRRLELTRDVIEANDGGRAESTMSMSHGARSDRTSDSEEGDDDEDEDETLVGRSSRSSQSSSSSFSSSSSISSWSTAFRDKCGIDGGESDYYGEDRVAFPRLALTRLSPELKVYDPDLP
ncbi:hypothetical protein BGZ73_007681 [Actinomortierella ambigua]|nr:hypothetical protein BGZ73_007681 [Actinomortierella ambigua]